MAFLSVHSSPVGQAGAGDTGGMSTYLRGLAEALGAAGHRVDLFTRAAGGEQGVRELFPGVRLVLLEDGLGPLAKEEIYPHTPAIAAAAGRFFREEDSGYDLLFSHYWLSGCVGRALQKEWHVPHFIMFHTMGRAKNEACPAEKEPALRIAEEEELARSADLVITAAEQEQERVRAYYGLPPEKTALIGCGIDRGLFRPLYRREAKERVLPGYSSGKVIFSAGRIEPVKGFDLLIRAAGLFPPEDSFTLLIAGGDRQSRARVVCLKEQAAELGISDRLIFTGLVDHGLLPVYYSAADVTVIPSHYESFGLVALESIACGTPVAAGPTGVLPELFSPENCSPLGCLVSGREPETWAAKIRELLIRPGPIKREDINRGLAPYNWPEAAGRLVSLARRRLREPG